ncbi:MAG: prolyl oligopeptidase family serine peptidase [Bacteroidia bacterium]|nr:prolyl oligopeptidase family serine peptidase [Bacteroidia bacterium]
MKEEKAHYQGKSVFETEYLIWKPDIYDQDEQQYPLIVFFHGGGERGTQIESIRRYGIFPYLPSLDLPWLILAIQCGPNRIWDYHFSELDGLLEHVSKDFRVKPGAIVAIGFSLGGYGALHYAMYRPDLIRGVVSIAGGALAKSSLARLLQMPVLLIHGEKDDRVNWQNSLAIYEFLQTSHQDVTFVLKPYCGHELCTTVFEEELIYTWLKERFA